MGKVAQALVSGYWPDRVPRRVAVPLRPLSSLLEQARALVKAGSAAVITRDRVITYKEFYDDAIALAAGLAARAQVRSVVALLSSPGPELLVLVAAGQLAGCEVALLDPASPGSLARQLARLAPDLVVVGDWADRPAAGDLEVVSADALRHAGLKGAGAGERRPAGATRRFCCRSQTASPNTPMRASPPWRRRSPPSSPHSRAVTSLATVPCIDGIFSPS